MSAETREVRYVRFTPSEWATIEGAAERAGIAPSTYVRRESLRAAHREAGDVTPAYGRWLVDELRDVLGRL